MVEEVSRKKKVKYLISLTLYDKVTHTKKQTAYFVYNKITAFYRSVIDTNFTVLVTDDGKVWEVVETPEQISNLLSLIILSD